MADVRCPMCSKLNPAEAEVCRFCQARLKPLRPSSGGGQPEGDEPDWFSQLRSDSSSEGDSSSRGKKPSSPKQESSSSEPDWLSKIRDRARSDTSSSSLFDTGSENDESDWLRGLQDDSTQASSQPDEGEDWLSRLGDAPGAPASASQPGSGASEPPAEGLDSLSSWLGGLNQEDSPAPQEPESSQTTASSFEDWGNFNFEEEKPASSTPPAFGEEDDWMKNIGSWQADQPAGEQVEDSSPGFPAGGFDTTSGPASEETTSPFGQDLGWGQDFQETGTPAPSGADDSMDWLRGFDTFQTGETPAQTEEPVAGQDFSMDSFFRSEEPSAPGFAMPSEPEAPASGGEEVPDWLRAFDTPQSEPSSAQTPASDAFQWDGFGQFDSSAAPAQAEEPALNNAPQQEEQLPDWLAGMAAASAMEDSLDKGQGEGRQPAWLSGEGETPEAPAFVSSEEGGLPDWLSSDVPAQETTAQDFTSQNIAKDQPSEPGLSSDAPFPARSESPTDAALPDWFSAFGSEEPAAAQPAAEPEETGTPDWMNQWSTAPAQAEDVGTGAEEAVPPASTTHTGRTGPLPFIDEGLPDWLGEFQEQEPEQPAMPAFASMEDSPAVDNKPFAVDLPDWLNEEGAQEKPAVTDKKPAGVPSEELAQADLPSWVQAMRPVDTVIAGEAGPLESDQRVEKAGPLAGMRGVLPAEEAVIQYRKPPTYTVKLRVSEKQRSQISTMDNVLARETAQHAVPQVHSQAPWLVQRVLVALFLMVMLFGSVIFNPQVLPLPVLNPPEILDMYEQIDSLQPNDVVLLAVDYDPAFSGEMRFSATTIIDHLIQKQVRIGVVSTVPTGPALGNDLLVYTNYQKTRQYVLPNNVENLGFLPGGTISLLEFARNPHRAAPRNMWGEDAWSGPVLNDIENIQDFQRVIVITDRAEVGRSWVEQVQPFLGDVPLLIVSSAQASPLLQPYVNSSQVKGMVSGLTGGMLYGQLLGGSDPNTAPLRYWSAYQIGLLLVFLMVLIGSIFSAAVSFMKPRQKGKA